MRLICLAVLSSSLCLTPAALSQQTKTDAEIKVEAAKAESLYESQNFLGALPLFEDLHAQQPKNTIFDERLAMTLLSKAGQQSEPDATATRQRAKALLIEAKAAGDNSNLLQILLEKLDGPTRKPSAPTAGEDWLKKGEAAFSSGDLKEALANYEKALTINPQYYAAALFAGDAEYKMGHATAAGTWYAKAIVIDPDTETAYRYWGDCLDKAGDHKQAEAKFIDAIIADPYSRAPRVGLKQWADANRYRIVAPPVILPNRAVPGKNGNVTINIDASKPNDSETSLALMYSMNSALWQGEKFKKAYPTEKAYRHSLAEEVDSITGMLAVARETKIPEKKLSASTKTLIAIEKDGMLACYILLDNPDQGVAQDYVAYRKDHRDLMRKYIEKYDIHPM